MGNCFETPKESPGEVPKNASKELPKDELTLLRDNSYTNLKVYTLDGLTCYAKIVDVYDGDTFTIVFYQDGKPTKRKLRLYGCDAPEIKTKNEKEKKAALHVKDYVLELFKEHKNIVQVHFKKEEKFGRALGEVHLLSEIKDSISLTDLLVDNKYCKPYFGKKKEPWSDHELNLILRGLRPL